MVAGEPISHNAARGVRCVPSAPHRRLVVRSASTPKNTSCNEPNGLKLNRAGVTTIGRHDRKWNARSLTSSPSPGAGDTPESEDDNESPPMLSPEPPQSTGTDSSTSACHSSTINGQRQRPSEPPNRATNSRSTDQSPVPRPASEKINHADNPDRPHAHTSESLHNRPDPAIDTRDTHYFRSDLGAIG
jgi:hypothetical protein